MIEQWKVTAFFALVRREITRFLRVWIQSLCPAIITILLYFLVFGKVIGARLGAIDGVSYIAYITPGLIMMQVLTSSYTNTSSSFFGMKFSKSLEEILVSPMSSFCIVSAFVVGAVCRSLIIGILGFIVASFFVPLTIHHPFVLLLTLLFSSILFALLGLINGIQARTFDDVSWIPSFIITPMTYLGGVFYSIQNLPPIWRIGSMFDPIYYIVNAFRYGVLGGAEFHVRTSLIILTILLLVSYYWVVKLVGISHRLRH